MDVLENRRCVCRGYANLGVALMRAAGIPAIAQQCYTLSIDNDSSWDDLNNKINEANHIIPIAYVENRWVYMDITWDSDNKYENGTFSKKIGCGLSRKYFDTTLELISNTHRFINK